MTLSLNLRQCLLAAAKGLSNAICAGRKISMEEDVSLARRELVLKQPAHHQKAKQEEQCTMDEKLKEAEC